MVRACVSGNSPSTLVKGANGGCVLCGSYGDLDDLVTVNVLGGQFLVVHRRCYGDGSVELSLEVVERCAPTAAKSAGRPAIGGAKRPS